MKRPAESMLPPGQALEEVSAPPADAPTEPVPAEVAAFQAFQARLAKWWETIGAEGRLAVTLLVTLRLVLGILGVVGMRLMHPTVIGGNWVQLVPRGYQPATLFFSVWQRWDALWYQHVAQSGYQAGNGSIAFLPLYPALSRLVSVLCLGNVVAGELVVTSVAYVFLVALLYRLAAADLGPRSALLAVLLLTLSPVSFFLLAPYTESLFLALTLGAFYLARQGRPWEAALLGLAAGLTKDLGALLVLPLAWEYIQPRLRDRKFLRPTLASAALPAVAVLAVALFDRAVIDSRHTLFNVEAIWGLRPSLPWDTLLQSLAHIFATADFIEFVNFAYVVGGIGLAGVVVARLRLSYAAYVIPYLLVLVCHVAFVSPLESDSRYVLVLFPLFIALAYLLRRRPWLSLATLIAFALTQEFLFLWWTHFGFVA